jgi:hypothetical protein
MRYSDAGVCRNVSMSELLNREGLSTAIVRDSEFSIPRRSLVQRALYRFLDCASRVSQRQRVRLAVISAIRRVLHLQSRPARAGGRLSRRERKCCSGSERPAKPIVVIGAGGLRLMCLSILKALGGKGAVWSTSTSASAARPSNAGRLPPWTARIRRRSPGSRALRRGRCAAWSISWAACLRLRPPAEARQARHRRIVAAHPDPRRRRSGQ